MAELMKTKLPRKLVILALLLGCLGFLTSANPAMAADDWGNCGWPFEVDVTTCWPSLSIPPWTCTTERYACVICDHGSPCYPMYNN